MSFRDAPDPADAFRRKLQSIESRLRRLEQGSVLRGTPSAERFRIGDVLLEVDDSASPTLKLTATNLLTGSTSIVVTLP